jgi:hypothetical protein
MNNALSKLTDEDMRKIEMSETNYGQSYNVQQPYNNQPAYAQPAMQENLLYTTSVEDEAAAIQRKYANMNVPNTSSLEKLRQYADPDDAIDIPVMRPFQQPIMNNAPLPQHVIDSQKLAYNNQNNAPYINNAPYVNPPQKNPVIELFANAKRNTKFGITLQFDTKIPNIEFIKLMEDSYNESIIDFLAQEFTNNILANPNIIREKISNELRNTVSGAKKISGIAKINKKPKPKKDETEILNENNVQEEIIND